MATKKKPEEAKEAAGGEILQKAAKAVGATLGAIAKTTGIVTPDDKAEDKPAPKKGKLVKSAKTRLPRLEKKKAKKAAAKTALSQ